jgi:hypothetical protein
VNINNKDKRLNWHGKITLLFTAFLLLLLKFIYPEHNLLSWDVFGYYLYLPAKFIYHDPYLLHQEWLHQIVEEYESTATLYQINKHAETGNWIIKYSMGMSFLYAPFFFIAHWIAPLFGYKQDGFSAIYGTVLECGMFVLSLIGLNYLLKSLYQFFEPKIAIISFLLIVFATNYLQLCVQYSLLTHIPLFALYAILIYYSIIWNKSFLWKHFFVIASFCGLITLIRPNEVVCLLIPILWNVTEPGNFKRKLQLVNISIAKLLLGILLYLLPIMVQMYYWKKGTGTWLHYSYQNPGEGFDFLSPHVYQFLLSFRKGWFIYTPISCIALLSLMQVYRKQKSIFWAILLTSLFSIYVVSSWSCWWYAGGSYSQRAILSIYPLLAISLGYGLQFLWFYFRNFALFPLLLMLLLNVFQAWQFSRDILDHERMTFAYYKKIFFKTERPVDAERYLLVNRSADERDELIDKSHYEEKLMLMNNYGQAPIGKEYTFCDTLGGGDQTSVMMNETNEFLDGFKSTYIAITDKDHFWIKVSADVFIPRLYEAEGPRIVVHFNHGENGTYKYRNKILTNAELKKNQWNHIEYYYLSPEVRSKSDDFNVYLWHPAKTKVNIDNFAISVLIPKQ